MEKQFLPHEDPLITDIVDEELDTIDPDDDNLVEDVFLSEDHASRIDEVLKETEGTDTTNPTDQ